MNTIKNVVIAVFMIGSSVLAQSEWKTDKVHSSVLFTVRHMVISEVTGSFKDYTVEMKSAKDDFSDAEVQAVIKVGSISTDNTTRDNHLKSDDFFNAEKYPEMKFRSTSFEKTGDKTYKITGDLTIRDVTKNVTFDAVLNGTMKTNRGTLSAWKATTTINRFDYNLKWNKTIEAGGFIVGQDVTITLNLEMNK
ncbi:MAG: polyisoprenoid-binding protein [Ignavibacteriae bacterium]|nr:MAG: polyisoprenoid-binding protein [Ignavibacteriota bacterium]